MIQTPANRIVQSARAMAFVLALAAGSVAVAQESTLLTKPEVEKLAVGKTLKYVRASDSETMTYDVRVDGNVFHVANTRRTVNVRGQWTIGDDGGLCFKWVNTDRYVTLQDVCLKFRHAGEKIQVVGGRNPDNVLGDVVP
jgi:hypothetical protein